MASAGVWNFGTAAWHSTGLFRQGQTEVIGCHLAPGSSSRYHGLFVVVNQYERVCTWFVNQPVTSSMAHG